MNADISCRPATGGNVQPDERERDDDVTAAAASDDHKLISAKGSAFLAGYQLTGLVSCRTVTDVSISYVCVCAKRDGNPGVLFAATGNVPARRKVLTSDLRGTN